MRNRATPPYTFAPAPPAPPPRQPFVHFRRPLPGRLIRGTCLSVEPFTVWTHWDGARTLPCLLADGACEGCTQELPRRWQAYLVCAAMGKVLRQDVFMLTAGAALYLEPLVCAGPPWRGRIVTVERPGPSPNGACRCERSKTFYPDAILPAPLDVATALAILWRLQREGKS